MERIHNLLRKLQDIYYKQEEKQVIDLDLMLDYTRVLYADLLDARTDILAKQGMGLHLKQEPVSREPELVTVPEENAAEAAVEPEEAIIEAPEAPVVEEEALAPEVAATEIVPEEETLIPEIEEDIEEPVSDETEVTEEELVTPVAEEE